MLKNLKRLLNTFPDNSSGVEDEVKAINIQEIKADVIEEINEVKEELEVPQTFDFGFKLFSELMKNLRDKKNMKLLLLCRQIEKIEIDNKKARVIAEDSILVEICHTQEFYSELKNFFDSHGLSLAINKFEAEEIPAEVLREWLGKKLIIKN